MRMWITAAAILICAGPTLAILGQENGAPEPPPGRIYPVSDIRLEYIQESEAQPAIESIEQATVMLGRIDDVYVAPRQGLSVEQFTLGDFPAGDVARVHESGLLTIIESLVAELTQRGLISVFAAPDPFQIDESGADLRGEETSLTILIATGIVGEVRTLASGERVGFDIAEQERLNHPLHERIRRHSPIQPQGEARPDAIDLLRKDVLDRYIFHMSRHPGRRIDVALSPSETPGTVTLDYNITENRPLILYAQISNTGTPETERVRERFGLLHTQLTNSDDVFSLDYTTAGFDDSHAVSISYERPLSQDNRVRWRGYASWSEFTASEVGFFGDSFRGETWQGGLEIAGNIHQDRELFIDLVGGARFENHHVDNRAFAIEGEEEFFVPYVGVRLDRTTEWFATRGSLMFEFQSDDLNHNDLDELNALGRLSPADEWVVARWDLNHAFYLEPLLDPAGWSDPSTPESSFLAHEIALSFSGQHSFGDRLIPQAQDVVGGLYSVRGYPESVVAGDTTFIASAEYRFHVPRSLGIEPDPEELFGEPFRVAPQYVYGQPDWDLVLKGFVDIGRSLNANRASFEENETLIGAGVGLELILKRNFNVRLDWGFTLEDLESRNVDSGSNRLHFVATILF